MKLKAKQWHGIVESLTFLSIFLTCFLLMLQTSIKQESISKQGNCAYQNKRGFIGVLYDEATSDFDTFANGNENFNRRLYEHFVRPWMGPENYVISSTSIALGLAVLAIGSHEGHDGVFEEMINTMSLPCNAQHLKVDLMALKNQVRPYFNYLFFN